MSSRRKTLEANLTLWPQGKEKPFVFVNVIGTEGREHTGQRGKAKVGLESKFNKDEARKIVSKITSDLSIILLFIQMLEGKDSNYVGETTWCAPEANCSSYTLFSSERRNQKIFD